MQLSDYAQHLLVRGSFWHWDVQSKQHSFLYCAHSTDLRAAQLWCTLTTPAAIVSLIVLMCSHRLTSLLRSSSRWSILPASVPGLLPAGLTAPPSIELAPGASGLFDAEAPLTMVVSPDAVGLLLAGLCCPACDCSPAAPAADEEAEGELACSAAIS